MAAASTPAAQSPAPARASFRDLARATPGSRDRFIDFLRAFAIVSVVFGHWTMAVVWWRGGQIVGDNALAIIKGAWIGTWVFQVMPLFFVVGGFSNAATLARATERGQIYADFVRTRMIRLLRPVLVFGAVWAAVGIAMSLAGVTGRTVEVATKAVSQPLWFVGAYAAVIALSPAMIRLHRRFRIRGLIGLAVGAGAVDAVRFGLDLPSIGYLNYLLVWLFAQQVGFFYADGALLRLPRRAYGAMAVGGLLALTALGVRGPYPSSMVGVRGDPISNMDPPTIVIVALTIWQVGFAMLLRPSLSRWLARARVWAGVVLVNTRIMTIFLWHLTAMIIVVGIALPIGFPQPSVGHAAWWLLRPVWDLMLAIVLVPLVVMFARFEHVPPGRIRGPDAALRRLPGAIGVADALGVVGVLYVAAGIIGFGNTGFWPFATVHGDAVAGFTFNPLLNLLHLLVGTGLLGAVVLPPARQARVALWLSLPLGVAGVLGWWLAANPSWNALFVNGSDNLLHAATAVALAIVAVVAARVARRTAVTGSLPLVRRPAA